MGERSVISTAEIELVDAICEHRNELAHDLPRFVASTNAEISASLLGSIYDLVAQIDRWWIQEVEIPINPDFDGQRINDDEIQSGSMLFLQIMICTVTGEDFSAIWNEMQNNPAETEGRA